MAARRRKGASGKAKSSEARATGIPGGMKPEPGTGPNPAASTCA